MSDSVVEIDIIKETFIEDSIEELESKVKEFKDSHAGEPIIKYIACVVIAKAT